MNRLTTILLFSCGAMCSAQNPNTSNVTEYAIPTPNSLPESILLGPDGALWFTETAGNKIGRITPVSGKITEYQATGAPWDLIVGPDGAFWFTETNGNKIGRMTVNGVITNQFTIPTPNSGPRRIVIGPDNAMWFTEYTGNNIGRITTSGKITEYPIPTPNATPSGITAGPDGAIWFNENGGNQIVRMTTQGVITNSYPAPFPHSVLAQIINGPDGNLWITENWSNRIGRMTPQGNFVEWVAPTPGAVPSGLTVGPDGALWFTEWGQTVTQIGRITTDGVITEFPIPTAGSEPWEITAGPDGALWFVEYIGNKVGRIPACAMGMNVFYSNGTFEPIPALNFYFALGNTMSGTWTTWLQQNGNPLATLYSQPIGPNTPPVNLFVPIPLNPTGAVTVKSGLINNNGTLVCSETQTVFTGQ